MELYAHRIFSSQQSYQDNTGSRWNNKLQRVFPPRLRATLLSITRMRALSVKRLCDVLIIVISLAAVCLNESGISRKKNFTF